MAIKIIVNLGNVIKYSTVFRQDVTRINVMTFANYIDFKIRDNVDKKFCLTRMIVVYPVYYVPGAKYVEKNRYNNYNTDCEKILHNLKCIIIFNTKNHNNEFCNNNLSNFFIRQ